MKRSLWFILPVPLVLIACEIVLANIPLDDLQPFRKYAIHEHTQYYPAVVYGEVNAKPAVQVHIDVVDAPPDLADRFQKSMKAKGWKEATGVLYNGIVLYPHPRLSGATIEIWPDLKRDGSPNWQSMQVTELHALSPMQVWLLRLRRLKWDPFDGDPVP